MIKRWNHFAGEPYQEDADIYQWVGLIYRNFDKVIRILVTVSHNFRCLVCAEYSLNYTSGKGLFNHLLSIHRHKTVEFFLENILTKNPDELEEMLQQ